MKLKNSDFNLPVSPECFVLFIETYEYVYFILNEYIGLKRKESVNFDSFDL